MHDDKLIAKVKKKFLFTYLETPMYYMYMHVPLNTESAHCDA